MSDTGWVDRNELATKLGKLFLRQGLVEYYEGDCLEYLRQMHKSLAGKVDLIILDPPYEDWGKWLSCPEFWTYLAEMRSTQANMLCFSKQPFSADLWRSLPDIRWRLVWAFSNGGAWVSKKLPLVSFQDITVYSNPHYAIFNERTGGEYADTTRTMKRSTKSWKGYSAEGRRYEPSEQGTWLRDVIFVNKPSGQPIGVKPLTLVETLMKVYSNPDSLVLDPFAGRGTTMLAAMHLGRKAVGFEVDHNVYTCGCQQQQEHWPEWGTKPIQ